jgi:uncharacterized protein YjbI with pentapeptide repeats
MFDADLRYANLHGINFGHTTLSEALLSGADLSSANLAHAIITSAQLAQAKSLKGAIMPDGAVHP